ncbi:Cystathionine beta-lyase MetC [Listeria monocytogenes]|uniref:cystathionine beta-lyase n=1 Tax=Listeria monocytogenes TaxID=1639 RepID=UPI000E71D1F0|nr:cystathionine beta-lyase [Listeria monocytogenes]RKA28498.1 Cystathionine beta-lyase MetC [Listeria monocytogenes]
MANEYAQDTAVIKASLGIDKETGALNTPIHLSSTFHQHDFDNYHAYDYARSGNPTREKVEQAIAELEGGTNGFAFASGMAAVSAALFTLSKGDHFIIAKDVYGGTFRLVEQVLPRFGITHTFVDTTNIDEVAKAFQANTKLVYLETPSNPLLHVTDIRTVAKLAKANGCYTFVDNTFLTPLIQKPLDLGADLVIHSATKFLGGHSDILAGLIVTNNPSLAEAVYFLQNSTGGVLGVQDSWLLLRGLKTVSVRMKAGTETAEKIALFLNAEPDVVAVHYPGLPSHAGYDIQVEQATSGGAVLSFDLGSEEAVRELVTHLELPVFSVSLGAVESILSYPAKMSHAAVPEEERLAQGITPGLLRFSAGLEDADDLIADLKQALSFIKKGSVAK